MVSKSHSHWSHGFAGAGITNNDMMKVVVTRSWIRNWLMGLKIGAIILIWFDWLIGWLVHWFILFASLTEFFIDRLVDCEDWGLCPNKCGSISLMKFHLSIFKFSQWQWPIAMSKNEWSRCQLSNWLIVFHLVIASCLHCRSFIPTRFVWSSMLPHLVWRSTTNIVKQQKIWWRTSVSTNLLLPLSLDHG